MALAVDVFLDPNNVVPGGFTALAMFANRWWGWPVGVTLLALNVPFLLIGMRVLGLAFGPKTLLAILLSSLAIDLLRPLVPTVRGEPLLYTLYGGLLYGLGMGLVFRANATTGGTEIPASCWSTSTASACPARCWRWMSSSCCWPPSSSGWRPRSCAHRGLGDGAGD